MVHDELGFLPREVDFSFCCGEMRPLANHVEIEQKWKQRAYHDGYVYPLYTSATIEIPNSGRADLLQKVPSSHALVMEIEEHDKAVLRRGWTGFLSQFVGFLYGYRVQFIDWWVDGRVNGNSQARYSVCPSLGPACLNRALETWQDWDDVTQRIMTNALFMFSRSEIFEFGWERFMAEYMILDAIYKAGINSKAIESLLKKDFDNSMHKARLNAIAKSCGISLPPNNRIPSFYSQHEHEKDWDQFFVDLRNDLFHEMRWGGMGMLGTVVDVNAEQASYLLHEFSRRAIMSVLGIKGPYLASPWWSIDPFSFEIDV